MVITQAFCIVLSFFSVCVTPLQRRCLTTPCPRYAVECKVYEHPIPCYLTLPPVLPVRRP